MKLRYTLFAPLIFALGMGQEAKSQSQIDIVKNHVFGQVENLNLKRTDVNDLEITSTASSKSKDAQYVYLRQLINGIPLVNGTGSALIKDNKVIHLTSKFKSLVNKELPLFKIGYNEALVIGLSNANVPINEDFVVLSSDIQKNKFVVDGGSYSKTSIPVRLMYYYENGLNKLVWDLSILTNDNWWSIKISANSGEVLLKTNWVNHCEIDHTDEISSSNHSIVANQLFAPMPPPGADQYMVYALPNISPSHGNRVLVTNPSDPIYSPFGWHDDNGVAGDEYTITRGNNVYASDDIDDDDVPGYSPDGSSALNFNFPYDSAVGVEGNIDAVVTNLFYMNNMLHDIWAYYGFDEASGNFQETNYSNQGYGNDFVYADAQDGSGTNNANFGTPPDGDNPRMQMYIWTSSSNNILTVNNPINLAGNYMTATAGFGPGIPTIPITADVVLIDDGVAPITNGCEALINPSAIAGKIALVRRGTCPFVDKVQFCQDAGAVAVIVMNNVAGTPTAMGGTSGSITIPSVMITQADGNTFEAALNGGTVINATIGDPGDLNAKDSDFDNLVIAHEYGHGISNRLVGGGDNTDCLYNDEQMGEGWSDWFGLMITMNPTDLSTDPRGVGTYVTGQANNATGIRPAPYSTSFGINNYTYGNTNSTNLSQPHGIGFVWATMLWDLNWALIDEYGFDANVKTGTGGNNIAMSLVIEGLKLTACNPGFVDARDGILAADDFLYNGDNKCLIWEVFANRGLGLSANQGDAFERDDQVEAFDVPACIGTGVGLGENSLELAKVYPNPANNELMIQFVNNNKASLIRLIDLTGNELLVIDNNSLSELKLDISNLATGMYLLQMQNEQGNRVVEIIKK